MNDFLEYRENYLAHYGVLGMKWGVRKDRGLFSKTQNNRGKKKRPLSKKERTKRLIRRGAIVTASALAIYGGYRISKSRKDWKKVNKVILEGKRRTENLRLNDPIKGTLYDGIGYIGNDLKMHKASKTLNPYGGYYYNNPGVATQRALKYKDYLKAVRKLKRG